MVRCWVRFCRVLRALFLIAVASELRSRDRILRLFFLGVFGCLTVGLSVVVKVTLSSIGGRGWDLGSAAQLSCVMSVCSFIVWSAVSSLVLGCDC